MRNFSRKVNTAMIGIILSLAWPTMLEELMQTAVQYIDTAMVGSLGTHATAAVGATTTVNWLISSTISALSIGFLILKCVVPFVFPDLLKLLLSLALAKKLKRFAAA